jgi:hypothetical protein
MFEEDYITAGDKTLAEMINDKVMTQSKYLYIRKRKGGARNRDAAFDVPIHDCTNSPDLDDMITNGPGELTICEGDNDEMSWEWDDYIIVKTG